MDMRLGRSCVGLWPGRQRRGARCITAFRAGLGCGSLTAMAAGSGAELDNIYERSGSTAAAST